jgi:hypothetical protein
MAKGNFIRSLRQLILLTILFMIAVGSYLTRANSTSWEEPLWVTVYPIAADKAGVTEPYINSLTRENFQAVERFMAAETKRYGVTIEQPVRIDIGLPIFEQPPAPPADDNPLRIALWSLNLRWWARQATKGQPGPTPNIRLFLVYHDPNVDVRLPHSLGLQKGMLGVVHVFADQKAQGENNFIIAHEMLHTLGASDKYVGHTNQPIFPIGYAEPDRIPLYPQINAEIMGGRIPISNEYSEIPSSLKYARVGPATALEIRWIDSAAGRPVASVTSKKTRRSVAERRVSGLSD